MTGARQLATLADVRKAKILHKNIEHHPAKWILRSPNLQRTLPASNTFNLFLDYPQTPEFLI